MRTFFATALLLSSLASVACRSNDPEKCPAGERTMQPTADFADLGYPDGAVACVTTGLATPSVFYNGVDSEEAAAAKLTAFMTSKGYQGEPQAATARDLEDAAKGRTSTRILFVKDGASVRYHASLHATREGRAVSLSWMRADCAATPGHYICKK